MGDFGLLTVDELRRLFRGLKVWRVLVRDYGLEYSTITDSDGRQWNLWDIEFLLEVSQKHLPDRQAQAVNLFLVEGYLEREVALMMGIQESNPVGMYATDGLRKIVEMVQSRRLPAR